ncbi:MAG: hypothetical protein BIP78_0409 [Candidatus Bipolaricaulis sibiricus]|uniref:Uncharacterized protein n=1 Tax=Bipolaricaulis sibiricus TaxID=2501609 RepID=A0A410FSW5_BIPS1|nr:MAG: hypothetical protein BIP78_0409 [Candidatus Bipolaricaulis sibiricus]
MLLDSLFGVPPQSSSAHLLFMSLVLRVPPREGTSEFRPEHRDGCPLGSARVTATVPEEGAE